MSPGQRPLGWQPQCSLTMRMIARRSFLELYALPRRRGQKMYEPRRQYALMQSSTPIRSRPSITAISLGVHRRISLSHQTRAWIGQVVVPASAGADYVVEEITRQKLCPDCNAFLICWCRKKIRNWVVSIKFDLGLDSLHYLPQNKKLGKASNTATVCEKRSATEPKYTWQNMETHLVTAQSAPKGQEAVRFAASSRS